MRFVLKNKQLLLIALYVASFSCLGLAGVTYSDYRLHTSLLPRTAFNSNDPNQIIYVQMPVTTISFGADAKPGGKKLTIDFSIQIDKRDYDIYTGYQPRIMDRVLQFISQYDLTRLKGAEGFEEFRQKMIAVIRSESGNVPVVDIAFHKFILISTQG